VAVLDMEVGVIVVVVNVVDDNAIVVCVFIFISIYLFFNLS